MRQLTVIKSNKAALLLSFATIYFVWGSTFLAIKLVVAELPPVLAAGLRFALAGLILQVWLRFFTRAARPSWVEWRNTIVIGFFMFFIAYGLLFWAERSMSSGIASVLVATVPLWTILLEYVTAREGRPSLVKIAALLVGLVGVAIVSLNPQTARAGMSRCVAVLGSSLAWSVGSILSKRLRLPESKALGASMQMLTGGGLLLLASLILREPLIALRPSAKALAALFYLIGAGSILAFTCYVYLLHRLRASSVASYAYVNPVVALLLGAWFGHEQITVAALSGTALVIVSVVLVLQSSKS